VSHTLSGHFGQEANLLGIDSALRFLHSGRDDFLRSTMFSPGSGAFRFLASTVHRPGGDPYFVCNRCAYARYRDELRAAATTTTATTTTNPDNILTVHSLQATRNI